MRDRLRGSLAVTCAVVAIALIACTTSEDAAWGYSGPQSACSTGAAYEQGTTFPWLPSNAGDVTTTAAECVPRCGEEVGLYAPYGRMWTISALPRGTCTYSGEVCRMAALRTLACPDGTTATCSFTFYACRCEQGTWRCYSGVPGASACTCLGPRDGGASDGSPTR